MRRTACGLVRTVGCGGGVCRGKGEGVEGIGWGRPCRASEDERGCGRGQAGEVGGWMVKRGGARTGRGVRAARLHLVYYKGEEEESGREGSTCLLHREKSVNPGSLSWRLSTGLPLRADRRRGSRRLAGCATQVDRRPKRARRVCTGPWTTKGVDLSRPTEHEDFNRFRLTGRKTGEEVHHVLSTGHVATDGHSRRYCSVRSRLTTGSLSVWADVDEPAEAADPETRARATIRFGRPSTISCSCRCHHCHSRAGVVDAQEPRRSADAGHRSGHARLALSAGGFRPRCSAGGRWQLRAGCRTGR